MVSEPNLWRPLLDFLHSCETFVGEWRGWAITTISGGQNNRIFQVTHANYGAFAVKFTLRDQRHRARREFETLATLRRAGLTIAPKPVYLDETTYPLPVVVQTWLDGTPCTEPPSNNSAWNQLLTHYAMVHAVTPQQVNVELPNSVLMAFTLTDARACIDRELTLIPSSTHPPEMAMLMARLADLNQQDWSPMAKSICRGDANVRNFLQTPSQWLSVDWEYSGWGDPAFEIAELLAHPAYMLICNERRAWIADRYAALTADLQIVGRIRLYYFHMLIWWCARFARYRYELPRGLDTRLADRATNAESELEAKHRFYLNLAQQTEFH